MNGGPLASLQFQFFLTQQKHNLSIIFIIILNILFIRDDRKERRIFETYQREARSIRDKKDKEEIVALKQEVDYLIWFLNFKFLTI